jgi:hypothetical protein
MYDGLVQFSAGLDAGAVGLVRLALVLPAWCQCEMKRTVLLK